MDAQQIRKLEPGELFLLDDGRIAVVESYEDGKLTYVTCSDKFLAEREKEKNRLLEENRKAFLKMIKGDGMKKMTPAKFYGRQAAAVAYS